MKPKYSLRVSVLGAGPEATRWAASLRPLADVRPLPEQPAGAIDALVLARGAADPFARAKEALLAGIPVLYAAPFLLSPWQAAVLEGLSRSQRRLLRFAEPLSYRAAFAFLQRLLRGREPFWRPAYLRTVSLALRDGGRRIDELATQELAVCQALLDDTPRQVTAVAGRDETGDVCAAFLTVEYAQGAVVQCTVSVAEGTSTRRLVAVTPRRTLVIDDLDGAATLRIVAGGEEEPPALAGGRGRLCSGEVESAVPVDTLAAEARRFVQAVAVGESSIANGDRWACVAALWWAARQSMSFGGPVEVPVPAYHVRAETEPPLLTVIEGGGRTATTAGSRPSLTLVAG